MKSFRPERVAHVVRSVVSEAITCRLSDPRIETMSSVTRVEVSPDLEHAKVYISVMGGPSVQRRTLAGLQSARGFVQRMLAQELATRVCPQITFQLDESIKKGFETLQLIERVMAESRGGAEVGGGDDKAEDAAAAPEAEAPPGGGA